MVALAGLFTLLPSLGRPVVAAGPNVTVIGTTTYDVLPPEGRVAVTVDAVVTNHLRDTVTRAYYVDTVYLVVPPGADHLAVTAAAGTPKVSASARTADATTLKLTLPARLAAGASVTLHLTFDVLDPGGPPDRPLRISPSLVTFPVWALGTAGVAGSTVTVRLPAGYAVVVGRGPLPIRQTEPDGDQVFASGPIGAPEAFVADVAADRPTALVPGRRSISTEAGTLVIRVAAWPDDEAWRAEVTDLASRAVPALEAAIGRPWPLPGELAIREVLGRIPGVPAVAGDDANGVAFDPTNARLDVPYRIDPTDVLHVLAHGWFNGRLVADRWIAEGFAWQAARRAGARMDPAIDVPPLDAPAVPVLPLNGWEPGSAADVWAIPSAVRLADAIDARAGSDTMAAIWAAAQEGIAPYQPVIPGASPARPPEQALDPLDWRSFLDLLEERTGQSFDDLWRRWVVRPDDATLLDARAEARARYTALVAAAGDWVLPPSVRAAMRAWQFDEATSLMASASAVLEQRNAIRARADTLGLIPSDALREAFEGRGGLAAAAADATTELATLDVYDAALEARPEPGDLRATVGLLGADPDGELAAARRAFADGDLDGTLAHAGAARAAWEASVDLGWRRILTAVLAGVAVALLAKAIRDDRRRTARAQHAHRDGGGSRRPREG